MEVTLQHLSQSYKGCENEINELMIQIDIMLKDKKAEWDEKYETLQEAFSEQAGLLSNLEFEIKDKDKEISDLRNELVVLDKSNYERRLMLESKTSEMTTVMSDLKRQLKYYKNNEIGINDNYRDITITSLQKESNFLKDRIAEYEILHGTHNTQTNLLEEQRSSLLQKNEDLKQKLSKCRKEYQKKLEEVQKQFDNLGAGRQEHEKEVSLLKQGLSDKQLEIANVKGTLEDVLSSNQKNNSSFSQMRQDFESLTVDRSELRDKNKCLEEENLEVQSTLSVIKLEHKNKMELLQSSYRCMENDVLSLQSQVQLQEKENCFLRKLSLKQIQTKGNSSVSDQKAFFSRLESENTSLKNNILHMEKEIAALLHITEENYKRAIDETNQGQSMVQTQVEIRKVKERYEKHLRNMKTEIEELKLENSTLKVMNDRSSSNNSSLVNSTDGLSQNGELDSVSGERSHKENTDDLNSNNNDVNFTLATINITQPVVCEPPSEVPSDLSLKTPQKNTKIGMGSSGAIIKEFELLQENFLKDFEVKLDGYLVNFKADMET